MAGVKQKQKAEEMLRAHWEEKGLDPDGMASLDGLGENEREAWLTKAAAVLEDADA